MLPTNTLISYLVLFVPTSGYYVVGAIFEASLSIKLMVCKQLPLNSFLNIFSFVVDFQYEFCYSYIKLTYTTWLM